MQLLKIRLQLLFRYFKYFWQAKTRHDIHSPFVSEFVEKIVEDERNFYPFVIIENLRSQLLRSRQKISIQDFGAGSKVQPGNKRLIRSIARHSAISPTTGKQLFRLVHLYKPSTILELGTSLGISTLYLSTPSRQHKLVTIEGCPQTAKLAKQHFNSMGLSNIYLLNEKFEEGIPKAIHALGKIDLLYLDGDHREEASLQYLRQILPFTHPKSILIIADIHWSEAMEKVWAKTQKLPVVTLSLDLFHYGVLFFDPAIKEKQHFNLIKAKWKLWRIGI